MNLPISLQTALTQFLLFLPKLVTSLVVFVVTLYLAAIISRLARKAMVGRRMPAHVIEPLGQLVRLAIVTLGTITALQQVDFDVTAFVAGLGIMGFAVGFALQDIAQNFVSGILLLVQRPFSVGDFIQVESFQGHVQEISLRATRLTTLDGEDVLIPNRIVYANPITNYTLTESRRVQIPVGVAYDSDLDLVAKVVIDTVSSLPLVLADPPPQVSINNFGDSSIDLTVFVWVDAHTVMPNAVKHVVVTAIKKAFDTNGIDIPFPIRTLQLMDSDKALLREFKSSTTAG